MLVVDGENAKLGRLAAFIAKELLNGEEVYLVNSEKLILSGNPRRTVERYLVRRRLKNKANPEHSPHWSRVPHLLVKRIIRGMLPWDSRRGREAYKKLKVYIGKPEKVPEAKKFPELDGRGLRKYMTVERLCKQLGYNSV